jgi:hypothetical protein
MLRNPILTCSVLLFTLASNIASSSHAQAEQITITLGGATFTAVQDTVTLTPRTFTLDLTPDVPLTALLQSGTFTVVDLAPMIVDETVNGTLSRTVTAGAAAGTLSQPVRAIIHPTGDSLFVLDGMATRLSLGGLRQLEITPLRRQSIVRTTAGPFPFDLQGTFRLIAVPEPSTVVTSGFAVLGLLNYRGGRKGSFCSS